MVKKQRSCSMLGTIFKINGVFSPNANTGFSASKINYLL